MSGLIIDYFAGGGGASCAIEDALGRSPDLAVNHNDDALSVHAANHPATTHLCADVYEVEIARWVAGRPVDLFWASPDCRHFSKAKGAAPVSPRVRGLAWVVVKVAAAVKPRIIILENVEEFATWGPVLENGRPCPDQKGFTFRRWVQRLEELGYRVEHQEMVAADYGEHTIRKRLKVVARRDGQPIAWPRPTHAPANKAQMLGLKPWAPAHEIIDWSLPCPSIFDRERPLVEKTLNRIAKGIERYVINAARPFIVPVINGTWNPDRTYSVEEPLRTVTASKGGDYAVVSPFVDRAYGKSSGRPVDAPLGTETGHAHTGIAAAWLEQANTGVVGHAATDPLSTITGRGTQQRMVAAMLTHAYGSNVAGGGGDLNAPQKTVKAGGNHHWLVDLPMERPFSTQRPELRAFLAKYYGTATACDLADPLHSVTSKARFGLVTVSGVAYQIRDIGMRMLSPRELFNAQGFPADYIIDRGHDGRVITKTAQTRLAGNSVCRRPAAALLRANLPWLAVEREAA